MMSGTNHMFSAHTPLTGGSPVPRPAHSLHRFSLCPSSPACCPGFPFSIPALCVSLQGKETLGPSEGATSAPPGTPKALKAAQELLMQNYLDLRLTRCVLHKGVTKPKRREEACVYP